MKNLLITTGLIILMLYIPPKNKEDQNHTEDRLEKKRETKLEDTQYFDSLSYEQDKKFTLFLGLEPSQKYLLSTSDTLITYHHDFSYAGFLGGKYSQILKTDSSIYLTQVFYSNQEKKDKQSFSVISHLTGMELGELYSNNFKRVKLSLENWNSLILSIEKNTFFRQKKEDCQNITMDGPYSIITFHCKSKTHIVERHNCFDDNFYKICLKIDSFSPDPIKI